MQVTALEQHQWLQQFVGTWEFELECGASEEGSPTTSTGVEVVRPLGDLWILAEAQMNGRDGMQSLSVMTLGYDPTPQRFVGSFVSSMMSHFWSYNGILDPEQKVLTLDAQGPSASDGGSTTALYKDAIEYCSESERKLTSRMLGDDGIWQEFMIARYQRVR